jgi:hypothetical protein
VLSFEWFFRGSTLIFIRIYHKKQMKVAEGNTTIVDGYVGLLDNLSTSNKLDLITKLTASVKTDLSSKKSSLKKAFGAFDSQKTAEEIIEEIRSSRVSTRQIESF